MSYPALLNQNNRGVTISYIEDEPYVGRSGHDPPLQKLMLGSSRVGSGGSCQSGGGAMADDVPLLITGKSPRLGKLSGVILVSDEMGFRVRGPKEDWVVLGPQERPRKSEADWSPYLATAWPLAKAFMSFEVLLLKNMLGLGLDRGGAPEVEGSACSADDALLVFLFFLQPPPTGTVLRAPPFVQYLLHVLQKWRG